MKEALKLALDALEYWDVHGGLHQPTEEAITALRLAIDVQNMASESTYKAALAQPAQEPEIHSRWQETIAGIPVIFESKSEANRFMEYHLANAGKPMEQPAQAPTGMLHIDRLDKWLDASLKERKAQRTWVGLTDEEIQAVAKQARSKDHAVTLTNKLLKEKNT